jgi:hypothetical protein
MIVVTYPFRGKLTTIMEVGAPHRAAVRDKDLHAVPGIERRAHNVPGGCIWGGFADNGG